jgi:hypothetical protein
MNTFSEQLALTRANLERVETLFAAHPGLFECARGIYVQDDSAKIYIHAGLDTDWKAFASRYRQADWKRERGSSGGWDYRGTINGVELCILGAEKHAEPAALDFTEEAA